MIRFVRARDYDDMSRKAANIIAAQMIMKPDCVLGLATGSTPIGAYSELVEKYERGAIDFSEVTTVNLDEYRGISGDNDQSYRYFMNTNLFNHVNINKENTFVPNGLEPDSEKACSEYDAVIERVGGIDLQLLGIGLDGHIGFNEPDDVFVAGTHVVELDESTIEANARFFASIDDVPRSAITMGMGAIMQAKKVLLIANGEKKADIVKKARFQGHDLEAEREHIIKELGDVAWYVALGATSVGVRLSTILEMNVDKLQTRYPNGFDSERSQHRAEGDI